MTAIPHFARHVISSVRCVILASPTVTPELVTGWIDDDTLVVTPIASALTGRSIPAIRKAVDDAELPASIHGRDRYISPLDLAAWQNRPPYTPEEYLAAFRQVEADFLGGADRVDTEDMTRWTPRPES